MSQGAAAGYINYADYFTTPVFSQRFITDFWDNTVFKDITTTDYMQEAKFGQVVHFNRTPPVRVRKRIKNQQIEHDTTEGERTSIVADKMFDYSLKFDCVDVHNIRKWKAMVAEIRKAGAASMAKATDECLLHEAYMEVHPCNEGANAGIKSKCYNMGTLGAPVCLNADNVVCFLSHVGAVLDEQNCPSEDRWGIAPGEIMPLLAKALGDASYWGLAMSPLLNGRLPSALYGFNMHKSHNVAHTIDPVTQDRAYHMLFGHKKAIALAVCLEKIRTIDNDKDSWDVYIQALQVWGWGVIRKDCLVHAYVKFEKTKL